MKISLDNIDAFVFDFDGVLTNNFDSSRVLFIESKVSLLAEKSIYL